MAQFGIVLVTAGSEAEARHIAAALVEERLAACVSLLPIRSVYRWQGEVKQDHEWQLVIKTRLDEFAELEARIQALHSYEVPEVIALPIQQGAASYLDWIQAQTADDSV
ncbi:divalent-cation tolerance protein CutA [Romeria aff. gracilis LEGE 07310]|uniref:Divalent-cation tolerance protein CutA n=1 Tax=Vasconcelosia minhoensis LEGE 07310 TaxID=915328 RepID=A0A8J7DP82_9CYAN|nr:divalent-cation tolerance protein CutA [Romeria gracilis]MBE9079265.1 divalent-cation tolerance protein CutA [Romeria aff. gracilis LEGE 07310]